MSSVLIHAEGGGKGTAADNGYACQLAEALDSPVLTKAAVQDGEGGVEFGGAHAVHAEFHDAVQVAVGRDDGGDAFRAVALPGIVLQCGGVAVEAEPFAALCYAEQY